MQRHGPHTSIKSNLWTFFVYKNLPQPIFFQTNGRVRSRYVFTYRKQWKWAGHCLVRGPYFHCFIIKCGSEFQKVACAVKDSIKQLISKLTQSQIFLDERNCFLNFFRFCTRGQFLFCSLLNGVLQ